MLFIHFVKDRLGELRVKPLFFLAGIPNVKAWGKKKSTYYATDVVDADIGELM